MFSVLVGKNDSEEENENAFSFGDFEEERKEVDSIDNRLTMASSTVLTFSKIKVSTRTIPKSVLLDSVSGSISGGFWAIMGASGSGKTLLLSTLSLRLDPNFMHIEGTFRLNGRQYSKNTLKIMSAYVMQDDLLHPELTVRETLNYAAQLRMTGDELTAQLRANRELELLKLMGIDHCGDTIVGDTRKKGISGGERKRLCVAIELLNRPKLLFLDEPTSGLDSSTALSVCEALKHLSDSGECTVVCTIHQPQPKIFNLFDNLILMKRGVIVWQGRASHSIYYLMQMNLPLPPETHLADFLLDVISPGTDGSDRVEAHRSQHTRLMPPVDLSLGREMESFDRGEPVGHACEFSILFHRNMRQYLRRWDLILMNLVATSLLAIFVCMGIWYDIGTGQSSIATRAPSLFFICVTQGVLGSLQSVNSFPAERAIMLRERAAGAYHVSSYFAAKSVVDMLSQLWPPIVFSCIVYFAIGYQPVTEKFFIYVMFMVLDSMAAISMAAAVTCFCVSVEMSTIVLSVLFEWCRLYGGFFFSPAQFSAIPRMNNWRFADALSYLKYVYVGVALNELHGLVLTCPDGETCQYTTGEQIAHDKGYDEYTIGFCAGILVVYIVGCRLVAYIGLRVVRY